MNVHIYPFEPLSSTGHRDFIDRKLAVEARG